MIECVLVRILLSFFGRGKIFFISSQSFCDKSSSRPSQPLLTSWWNRNKTKIETHSWIKIYSKIFWWNAILLSFRLFPWRPPWISIFLAMLDTQTTTWRSSSSSSSPSLPTTTTTQTTTWISIFLARTSHQHLYCHDDYHQQIDHQQIVPLIKIVKITKNSIKSMI